MAPRQINADQYLFALASTSPEDNPYTGFTFPGADVLGKHWAAMCNAAAAYVQAARTIDGFGYEKARAELESFVHMFPTNRVPRQAPAFADGAVEVREVSVGELKAALQELSAFLKAKANPEADAAKPETDEGPQDAPA